MSLKRSGAHAERSTTAKRRKSISTPDKSQHTDSAVRAPESKPNATRIRFDSEEPLQPEAATIESLQDEESEAPLEEDDESEDEAPEAVTASEAQALAKTAAAEVSRAFERDRLVAKQLRKQTDEKRKAQSKRSSKRTASPLHTGDHAEVPSAEKSKDEDEEEKTDEVSKLPDLLPDELLTDDLFDRPPSPEAVTMEKDPKKQPAKRVIKFDTKPKDVRAGPVNVSVLEKFNRYLPPKVNRSSRNLKESWLAGRRGIKGQSHERQKYRHDFVCK